MIDFLILYEHKARELENDCLIKAELEKRGYRVEIINVYEYKSLKYLTYKKPKVIVVPFLYDDKDILTYVYPRVGCSSKIVNLQWEQVLSRKWENIGFHLPKEDAMNAVHICWGNENKKRLKNAGVKKAFIAGPIQMDFLRENFKPYYKTKDQLLGEYNIDKKRKLILFISSFTLANLSNSEIRTIEKRVSIKFDYMRNAMSVSKHEMVNWIIRLLKERNDITFIYRPHPNEKNDAFLLHLEKEYDNFKVIDEYSVKQWILVSDKIMTWFSTAIAEVYFAGKSCSIIRPVELNDNYDSVINIGADKITSYEQMFDFINNPESSFPIKPEVIKKHYSFDALPSYIRISNILEKVLLTKKYDFKRKTTKVHLLKVYIDAIIDELIIKLNLINSTSNIVNEKLQKRTKTMRDEYGRFGKEMVSKKDIEEIVGKIKRIIS